MPDLYRGMSRDRLRLFHFKYPYPNALVSGNLQAAGCQAHTAGGNTLRPLLQRHLPSTRSVRSSCFLFASFAQQVGDQHAARAPPTHRTLSHQQPRELVLTAAALAVLILTLILFFPAFTSLA